MQTIQSRMKSRKILGVGEAADGQLHRSKITQILGNDSLTSSQIAPSEYPIGLQVLQWTSCLWFSWIGLVSMFYPKYLLPEEFLTFADIVRQSTSGTKNIESAVGLMIAGTRLYGAAMIALGSLCLIVTIGNWHSRRAIRITLLVEGMFCAAEILASVLSGAEAMGLSNEKALLLNAARMGILLLSVYFFKQTGPYFGAVSKRVNE